MDIFIKLLITLALTSLPYLTSCDSNVSIVCKSSSCEVIQPSSNQKLTKPFNINSPLLSIENVTMPRIPMNLQILNHLEHLTFKNNQMIEIHRNDFAGLKNLKILEIRKNEIRKIPLDAFEEIKNLKILNLRHNFINEMHANTFAQLANLIEINLDENKITFINRNLFAHNKNLKIISINTNYIKKLHIGTFRNNRELIEVNFHANDLQSLSGMHFENNQKLKKIDFSNNKLNAIAIDVLSSENLTEFDFEWNNCTNNRTTIEKEFLVERFRVHCEPDWKVKYEWAMDENEILRDCCEIHRNVPEIRKLDEKLTDEVETTQKCTQNDESTTESTSTLSINTENDSTTQTPVTTDENEKLSGMCERLTEPCIYNEICRDTKSDFFCE